MDKSLGQPGQNQKVLEPILRSPHEAPCVQTILHIYLTSAAVRLNNRNTFTDSAGTYTCTRRNKAKAHARGE